MSHMWLALGIGKEYMPRIHICLALSLWAVHPHMPTMPPTQPAGDGEARTHPFRTWLGPLHDLGQTHRVLQNSMKLQA